MDLWTEYEGVTIDSTFALTQLLQPEGRSAFFSTINAKGESVLIRIIECHFDEDEILARWRGVEALGHPNFLRIDRFGHFLIGADNATAVYAVFERIDANLGEVLERGRLSAADAAEIGRSVSSALETLHANGFVHEHIETRNIYAVGDTVKLRSDCIREAPEGEAGAAARRRDVHELGVVLMQVLLGTPHGSLAARQPLLPEPFDDIVRNGMNGSWGLAEIKAALGGGELPQAASESAAALHPAVAKAAGSAVPAASQTAAASTRDFSARGLSSEMFAKPAPQFELQCEPQVEPRLGRSASPGSNSATYASGAHASLPGQKRASMELPVIFGISERDYRRWTSAGALLLGVVLLGWIFLPRWFGHSADGATRQVAAQLATASSPAADARAAASSSVTARSPSVKAQSVGSQSRLDWRVVAFTYSRQDQAQKKASSLERQHPDLRPATFSPTGRAPWLVTVGGALQRDAAYALARKARSLGLPRDTYAQNYTAR